jgi:hypothetical protein
VKNLMLGLAGASLLAVAACSSGGDNASTAPTVIAPATPAVTDTFSGTVQVGGYDANPFTVTASGAAIAVTLTVAGPPATISMGLGVGSYVGTQCTLLSGGFGTYQAGTAAQLSGTIASGQYCVMVYDVGNQSAPVTYTVTVAHY